ncbi:MAG: nucleotidyltransferase family protein [Tissierellia bacterium]|nr:nucleotidyltransferase family protein [Tissierellia bacterium]
MIIGIILASGFSRRMKKDKLLLEVEGIPIIERVIKACRESNLDEIILTYRRKEVANIGEKYNIKTVYNENAHLGQSEGMKLGVKEAKEASAYMFFVGDQPFITSDLINRLIGEYKKNKSEILVPFYKGNRGMPTIISSNYKDELLEITGDKGARNLVNKYIHKADKFFVEDDRLGMDIDTIEDLVL